MTWGPSPRSRTRGTAGPGLDSPVVCVCVCVCLSLSLSLSLSLDCLIEFEARFRRRLLLSGHALMRRNSQICFPDEPCAVPGMYSFTPLRCESRARFSGGKDGRWFTAEVQSGKVKW